MGIQKEITTVTSYILPVDEHLDIQRCRYSPEGGGNGRICLATGMHGDELMGQLILYTLSRRICAHPEHLKGTVDLYPALNPLGLDILQRLYPSGVQLDMNLAFPGKPDGTVLESLCYAIHEDMRGSSLVIDIHASTHFKSEVFEVRMNERFADSLIDTAKKLCPDMLWIYPESPIHNSSLSYNLCSCGTPSLILEVDERHRHPYVIANRAVDGIFCTMKHLGLWDGETVTPPETLPCTRSAADSVRIACSDPGIFVPEDHIGEWVSEGTLLGTIIDALEGKPIDEIQAPFDGYVFSERSYGPVYPGTLVARLLRKECKA